MTADDDLEPSDDHDGERAAPVYAERLRISAAARASLLDTERQRLHDDLQGLRRKAGGSH